MVKQQDNYGILQMLQMCKEQEKNTQIKFNELDTQLKDIDILYKQKISTSVDNKISNENVFDTTNQLNNEIYKLKIENTQLWNKLLSHLNEWIELHNNMDISIEI